MTAPVCKTLHRRHKYFYGRANVGALPAAGNRKVFCGKAGMLTGLLSQGRFMNGKVQSVVKHLP